MSVAAYADAIGDFLDSMRFRQVDLLGAGAGAAVAVELAAARAESRQEGLPGRLGEKGRRPGPGARIRGSIMAVGTPDGGQTTRVADRVGIVRSGADGLSKQVETFFAA